MCTRVPKQQQATNLGDGMQWNRDGERFGIGPRDLAVRRNQHHVVQYIDDWLAEREIRHMESFREQRALTVSALQRLALSTTLHRMVQSSLQNHRLFLPAYWRPSEALLSMIVERMPTRTDDAVVQRFLPNWWVWRRGQERRIQRMMLYMAKDLSVDTRCEPKWKSNDPHSALYDKLASTARHRKVHRETDQR